MSTFAKEMKSQQVLWRRAYLSNQVPGRQNNRSYDYILPYPDWKLNLWPGIVSGATTSLPSYLEEGGIHKHTGCHNLLSSWVLCANLYFPFRDKGGRDLLASFFREVVSQDIEAVSQIELEFESPNPHLTPKVLLGESDGARGAGQTSPDVAFAVQTLSGPGIILVESKFTEHHFYSCSGRKKNPPGRPPNPDVNRCLNPLAVLISPETQCHLCSWGRLYWKHLASGTNPDELASLKCCPAAFDGYQLFRQQALAEAFAASGTFSLVVSAVAHDARNKELMHCMSRSSGLKDIRTGWIKVFNGQSRFVTFTHQYWVNWVSSHAATPRADWLRYVCNRYGMA